MPLFHSSSELASATSAWSPAMTGSRFSARGAAAPMAPISSSGGLSKFACGASKVAFTISLFSS